MAETKLPKAADPNRPQTRQERMEYGRSVLEAVNPAAAGGVLPALDDVSPALGEQVLLSFGDIYSRPQLSPRDRQLLTLGILTALGGCEAQLEVHVNTALNVGLSPEAITEAFLHATAYCGFPRALNATFAAKRVFAERGLLPIGEEDNPLS